MKNHCSITGETPTKIAQGILVESRAIRGRVSYLIALENGNRNPGKLPASTIRRRIFQNCENIAEIKQKYGGEPAFFASIIKALLRQQAKAKMESSDHKPYDKQLVGEFLTLRSTRANTFFVLKVLATLGLDRDQIERIILGRKIQKND